VTITAVDLYDNTVTSYTGSHSITFSGPSSSPAPASTAPTYDGNPSPDSITFTSGVGSATTVLFDAQTITLNASDGTYSGSQTSITVAPLAIHSFW